ncbi:MAG: CotH kinase family protein, partial [Lachnospiraceae bacterium]|nr:CotH kinase family protein [Lachnospiraceae bacterium]
MRRQTARIFGYALLVTFLLLFILMTGCSSEEPVSEVQSSSAEDAETLTTTKAETAAATEAEPETTGEAHTETASEAETLAETTGEAETEPRTGVIEGLCQIYLGSGSSVWNGVFEDMPEDLIGAFALEEEHRYGFVLPAAWDLADLRIWLSGAECVRIDGKEYQSGDAIALEPGRVMEAVPEGGDSIGLTIRQTGGLEVMFIRTESGSCDAMHADKSVKEKGILLMTGPGGETLHSEALKAVRTRGNATFGYSKKPYQIKLENKAALIEGKESKTWILLANALDRAHLRNAISLDLARTCGRFSYTPDTKPVDLYLNNDYKGTYLLTEKAETGKNRENITDLEKLTEDLNPDTNFEDLEPQGDLEYAPGARKYYDIEAEPEDVTGGYLFQTAPPVRYATEESAFVTNRGCLFTMQQPKYMSKAQMDYLADLMQQVEDALFSEDGVDPATGKHYTELVDLATFADRYLLAEVVDDFDGHYFYFHKDADSVDPKLYAGPVWDQDNILGEWKPHTKPSVIHLSGKQDEDWYWFTQAGKHEDFMEAVKAAYRDSFRQGILVLLGQE